MLNLELAKAMCDAALAEAAAQGAQVSVAIVDQGGHLIAFQRMDGAEIAGPVLATDKAYTAVANRIATAELTDLAKPGAELAGLHANGNGRFVVFGGGVPLWNHEHSLVVGGIGVSGGAVVQDVACAKAALRLWESTK